MIHLPGMPCFPLEVAVTNLYDVFEERNGRREEKAVRGVLVRGAGVDLRVLSLELPPDIVEQLGLTADPEGTDRLSPVRLTIMGRCATVPPCRGASNKVVVGHVALTALGLKLDTDGQLVDDPFPVRFGPLDVF